MANKVCTAKLVLTFTDDSGGVRAASASVAAPYMGFNEGLIDVPDLESGSTEHSIPFGSIAKATAVYVKNMTGQDQTLKINGSAALCDLPDGSAMLIAAAALPSGTALTAVSLTSTGVQAGAGSIGYKVFGDPV